MNQLDLRGVEHNEANLADIDIKKDDDKLLADKIEVRLGDGQSLHKLVCDAAEENYNIFNGNLEKVDEDLSMAPYKSKALVNRIYLTVRNLVGLATDKVARCYIMPSRNTPQSIEKAGKIEAAMEAGMIRTNYQDNLALALIDTWVKIDSFQHWFWNYDKNDLDVCNVSVEDLTVSPEATDIQTAEYVIYHPPRNKQWWKKNYPEYYDKIKFESLTNPLTPFAGNPEEKTARPVAQRLIQYWENDIVISKVKGANGDDIILEKKANPYWEYRSVEEQYAAWVQENYPGAVEEATMAQVPVEEVVGPEAVKNFAPITNYLSEARKPFVQIPGVKTQGSFYSTNLIKQIKEVFLSMNKKKRQIDDNLRGCNVKIVVDSDAFTGEEASKISDLPLQVIKASFQQSPKPVYIVQPTNFEIDKIHADIAHDEKYIDDVFGHHEISRGGGASPTLGQDKMNYESDKTPIRQQVRNTERAIKEIWEGWIQLMKMFYTDEHYIRRMGAKGGLEMVKLINSEIEDGIEPILKPASTMPVNKLAQVEEAINLWKLKATDPYNFFVDIGKIDPEERSNRLINWQMFGLISDEDPEKIRADMQNQTNSEGDMTDNPIERADQENEAIQAGGEIPPTPPELVSPEHVKLHYAFAKDPNKEMEQENYDLLLAHAETDKATLSRKMVQYATRIMKNQQQEQASGPVGEANQSNQSNAQAKSGGKQK